MHDGIVWPLHLKPAHRNLSPVWKLEFPPSGDRIGECFAGSHTLEEMLELCGRLSGAWREGLGVLLELEPEFVGDPARQFDIIVAQALDLQFRTGFNILRFYDLRERILYDAAADRADLLEEARKIVEEEIDNSARMAALCEVNPFLGFQAEAEGYTYSPAELHWRVERLQDLLNTEFVEAAAAIAAGKPVFPEASGLAEGLPGYRCRRAPQNFEASWQTEVPWNDLPQTSPPPGAFPWSWRAAHDDVFLYVSVESVNADRWRPVGVAVAIEPTHIYPRHTFRGDVNGKRPVRQGWLVPDAPWDFQASEIDGKQTFRMRIPFDAFLGACRADRPMRINVEITAVSGEGREPLVQSWASTSGNKVEARLGYGNDDPEKMGWLWLE